MAGKAGGKGPAKNPKKTKWEPDDDDDDNVLEDLVTTTEADKGQPSYSTLQLGDFVTKAEDRKERLEKRRAKKKDDDKADYDREETEQEKLECEACELSSQLKKVE